MIPLPGDKSISHRALLLALLADGESELSGLNDGLDVEHTCAAVRALGATLHHDGARLVVTPPAALRALAGPIDCGNAGTLARLLAGLLVGRAHPATLTGDASLSRRPMQRVKAPLDVLFGAEVVRTSASGALPLDVTGAPPVAGDARRTVTLVVPSAQVKSAVLFAALGRAGETIVVARTPTRRHTESLFRVAGLPLDVDGDTITLRRGPRVPRGLALAVPRDPSAAAFRAVLAVLGDRTATFDDVLLDDARLGAFDALARAGVSVTRTPRRALDDEPVGTLQVVGRVHRPLVVARGEVPALVDEVPALAMLAACTPGRHVFEGLAELRVKESDRLLLLVENLARFGVRAEIQGEDTLVVDGERRGRAPGRVTVRTDGDHRLAMAFFVLARSMGRALELDVPGAAAVSDPGFLVDEPGL